MRTAFFLGFLFVVARAAAATSASTPSGQDGSISTPASTAFSSENFTGDLARDLAAHFNLSGELSLELLRPWTPRIPTAASWQVVVTEYPAVAASSMLVRCRVLADGVIAGEPTIMLRAALWRDVWSAHQPIALGSTFDPAQLDARRVDLFRERDALPADAGDASFVFTRALASNRLLYWRDIARRPLVRKGDMVEVAASEGAMSITLKGQAMQNGAQGETITVRNLESKKDIRGLVVAESRVQVNF